MYPKIIEIMLKVLNTDLGEECEASKLDVKYHHQISVCRLAFILLGGVSSIEHSRSPNRHKSDKTGCLSWTMVVN